MISHSMRIPLLTYVLIVITMFVRQLSPVKPSTERRDRTKLKVPPIPARIYQVQIYGQGQLKLAYTVDPKGKRKRWREVNISFFFLRNIYNPRGKKLTVLETFANEETKSSRPPPRLQQRKT